MAAVSQISTDQVAHSKMLHNMERAVNPTGTYISEIPWAGKQHNNVRSSGCSMLPQASHQGNCFNE